MDDSTIMNRKDAWQRVLEIIRKRWEELQTPACSGHRAKLRRAQSPDEVAMQAHYYSIIAPLLAMDELEPLKRRISSHMPSVVGLLAHVKTDDQNRSFAEAMGTKKQGSDQPIVSDLRFRRILRVEDQDELYTTMIRVIRMLDGNVNVTDLATSVFFWNEQTRKRWASLYYLKRNIY